MARATALRATRIDRKHRGNAPLVFRGEVAGASLDALGAGAPDLVEGLLLSPTDAIAEALVRPVDDCTLGRVRGKARRLERLAAQASNPRDLLLHLPRLPWLLHP